MIDRGGVDFDDGQVVVGVAAKERRGNSGLVLQGDGELVGVLDDVVIGDDAALGVDEEAGTNAVALRLAAAESDAGQHRQAGDVDDRTAVLLVDADRGILRGSARGLRRRRACSGLQGGGGRTGRGGARRSVRRWRSCSDGGGGGRCGRGLTLHRAPQEQKSGSGRVCDGHHRGFHERAQGPPPLVRPRGTRLRRCPTACSGPPPWPFAAWLAWHRPSAPPPYTAWPTAIIACWSSSSARPHRRPRRWRPARA